MQGFILLRCNPWLKPTENSDLSISLTSHDVYNPVQEILQKNTAPRAFALSLYAYGLTEYSFAVKGDMIQYLEIIGFVIG